MNHFLKAWFYFLSATFFANYSKPKYYVNHIAYLKSYFMNVQTTANSFYDQLYYNVANFIAGNSNILSLI